MGGDGGYGGDGSYHFENRVRIPGNPTVLTAGYDPLVVGQNANFRVELRFSTASRPAEALIGLLRALINDANAAIDQLGDGATEASLIIHVPVIPRAAPPAGPPTDPWEVYVQWPA
jgi:hypothetical protein